MMQVLARRFRHWFNRPAVPTADVADDDTLPRAVPIPAPRPFGLEDTAPVDIDSILPPEARPQPPPLPSRRGGDGVVSAPVKEPSEWSAVIAAAKRRCEPSGHA